MRWLASTQLCMPSRMTLGFNKSRSQNRLVAGTLEKEWEKALGGEAEAVLPQPLPIAVPNDDLGELLGVGIDFDAEQLRRLNMGETAEVAIRAVMVFPGEVVAFPNVGPADLGDAAFESVFGSIGIGPGRRRLV